MTQFYIREAFAHASASQIQHLYLDESFNDRLCQYIDLERSLQQFSEQNGQIIREVRIKPTRMLPKLVQPFLPNEPLTYLEKLVFEPQRRRGEYTIVASLFTDKIRCMGHIEFIDLTPSGAVWEIDGEVQVNLPMIGKTIENYIIHDMKRSYQKAAEMMQTEASSI